VDNGGTAVSAWYNTPVYVGAFRVSFTYTNDQGADGMVFGFQNDSRGPTALGSGGGALAFDGIAPSAGLDFNIYGQNTVGIGFNVNGAVGPYTSTAPVVLDGLHDINVTLTYNGSVAHIVLVDAVTGDSFTADQPVDLPATLGASTAYMGFTGGDGGAVAWQEVHNFVYTPVVSLALQSAGPNSLTLSWPMGVGGYVLQSTTDLTVPFTNDAATVSQVAGKNQVTVSTATGKKFYRLSLLNTEP
jgi:hypothetical protein